MTRYTEMRPSDGSGVLHHNDSVLHSNQCTTLSRLPVATPRNLRSQVPELCARPLEEPAGRLQLTSEKPTEAIGRRLLIPLFVFWCALAACATHDRLSYNVYHRPRGYHWVLSRAPGTNEPVYYGVDPITHQTVYVGPDGIYYRFSHSPPITPADLHSVWLDPKDVPETAATPSQ
jgi:hypothetical protein